MSGRKAKQKTRTKSASMPHSRPLIAPVVLRLKAFIIDIFMIYVPILYLTAYLFLDGKAAFQANQWAILIDGALFASVIIAFWVYNGQSPGYRAYELCVIDVKTGAKPSLAKAIVRYASFLLAGITILGLLIAPFRNDKRNLHDILSGTLPVLKSS